MEVSCEVKDHPLDEANVTREVGEYLAKVWKNRVMGIVFSRSASAGAVGLMHASGAVSLDLVGMAATVVAWDWRKQDHAVHGFLHYLAHVEQNPDAVHRLLNFIRQADSTHDSLAYYQDASASS